MKAIIEYSVHGHPGRRRAGPYTGESEINYQRYDIASHICVHDVKVIPITDEDELLESFDRASPKGINRAR